MKSVVFAYHNMGLAGLRALQRAGYEISGIFSHEDDPDENCWFGSVKEWAIQAAIPVYCPLNVNQPEWVARIAALRPEAIFSFYYRHMLKDDILAIPERGAYNLHGSLLPAYRGRCPVNWVLVQGERQTGVTLHHMVTKADAGDIVGQMVVPIARTDTALILYKKLCDAAGDLLDRLLPQMKSGTAPRLPQDIEKGSYFGGRRPADGRIDWRWPAERIYNMIRAVAEPYPGAFCLLPDGTKLILWWGTPEEVKASRPASCPGRVEVEDNRVLVWAGQGRLHLADAETINGRMTGDGLIRYFKDREGLVLS
jgi:UDP-4-amino-4-deoxy-L-arabinose formyltransferase/UDP-glucuronic acid dehydrogenase (UDP-4-keto-hexauronic acid decarboxylating)